MDLRTKFKPCKIEQREVIEYVYEDVAYFTRPVTDGVHHTADWMLAMDDHRLVGLVIWR